MLPVSEKQSHLGRRARVQRLDLIECFEKAVANIGRTSWSQGVDSVFDRGEIAHGIDLHQVQNAINRVVVPDHGEKIVVHRAELEPVHGAMLCIGHLVAAGHGP